MICISNLHHLLGRSEFFNAFEHHTTVASDSKSISEPLHMAHHTVIHLFVLNMRYLHSTWCPESSPQHFHGSEFKFTQHVISSSSNYWWMSRLAQCKNVCLAWDLQTRMWHVHEVISTSLWLCLPSAMEVDMDCITRPVSSIYPYICIISTNWRGLNILILLYKVG